MPNRIAGMQAFLDQRGEDYDDCQSYSDLVSAYTAGRCHFNKTHVCFLLVSAAAVFDAGL